MGALRRFLDRLTESDEARLATEIREWAEQVTGSVRIAQAPMRAKVRIAGVIERVTVFPSEDDDSLEASVSDGTGEVLVQFMGRRAIQGLTLGTKVVLEGVLAEHHGRPRMMNPHLEFTA